MADSPPPEASTPAINSSRLVKRGGRPIRGQARPWKLPRDQSRVGAGPGAEGGTRLSAWT